MLAPPARQGGPRYATSARARPTALARGVAGVMSLPGWPVDVADVQLRADGERLVEVVADLVGDDAKRGQGALLSNRPHPSHDPGRRQATAAGPGSHGQNRTRTDRSPWAGIASESAVPSSGKGAPSTSTGEVAHADDGTGPVKVTVTLSSARAVFWRRTMTPSPSSAGLALSRTLSWPSKRRNCPDLAPLAA